MHAHEPTPSPLESFGGLNSHDPDDLARGLQTFAQGAPIGIALGSADGILHYANDEFLRIVGRSPDEFHAGALRWDMLTPPDWLPTDARAINAFQATGRSVPFEKEFLRPDGTRIPVLVGFTACTPDRSHAVAFVLDLTHRRQAETAAHWQAGLLDQAYDAIIVWEFGGGILFWNSAAEDLYGWPAADALGKNIHELLQTVNHGRKMEGLLKNGRWEGDLQHRTRDGRLLIVDSRLTLLHQPNGKTLVLETNRDATARRLAAADLAEREATLRTFFDSSPVPMGLVELDDTLDDIFHVYDNPATARFFGNPAGATDGHWATALGVPPTVLHTWLHHYRTAQHLRQPVRFDYLHKTGDREQWLSATVAYIGPTARGRSRFSYVAEDITHRKENEAALRESEERYRAISATLDEQVRHRTAELEDANAQLEGFAYSVSHDLRAPLRGMEGFSQALIEDFAPNLPPLAQEYLERIFKAARRMDLMIQDLLTYSRISRSALPIESFRLEAAVQDALQMAAEDIRTRSAQIEVEPCTAHVRGHRATLTQAVMNLVGNALKFVPPGQTPHIRIRCERRPQPSANRWRVWVTDNGIGIDPKHHERIFQTFERLHGNEAYAGTGIGLAIVKRGLERMGGSAGVESALGKGSRFWIELPADTAPQGGPP